MEHKKYLIVYFIRIFHSLQIKHRSKKQRGRYIGFSDYFAKAINTTLCDDAVRRIKIKKKLDFC